MNIEPIAYFHSPFPSKFGIPRQSGIIDELCGRIVFEPKYRNPDALRGLDGFDYLWLIWEFSANQKVCDAGWHPTVRPPLLGGNKAMGVFATRSPFRPNGLGLSSVRIDSIEQTENDGWVINVRGADLMDGTPIFDIKPYIAYADAHPGVRSGFVDEKAWKSLVVNIPPDIQKEIEPRLLSALVRVLQLDPRPQYHDDPETIYGMPFASYDVRFCVSSDGVLTVVGLVKR